MRAKLLVNDIHLGVQRSSGTTIESALAIKQYLLESLRGLLMQHLDKDIVINGDLFDQFSVPLHDVFAFYQIAQEWLGRSFSAATDAAGGTIARRDLPQLILGMGNHDWSKDSTKLSSFHLVGKILQAQYGKQVVVVDKPLMIAEGIYMIPHIANQDLFDLELARVPADARLTLVHANYNNHFAVESDHSLNVSEDQAAKLVETGTCLVFGHEHQARRALGGGVIITGNQWPSSVADCLNNPNGEKHAHIIGADYSLTPIRTWGPADANIDVNWERMEESPGTRFIRVSGKATADQSPEVIKRIARFRQSSDAFVISNAVQVEGVADMASLPQSMEDVKGFDVYGYLLEQLDAEQAVVVTRLLAQAEPERLAA